MEMERERIEEQRERQKKEEEKGRWSTRTLRESFEPCASPETVPFGSFWTKPVRFSELACFVVKELIKWVRKQELFWRS